MNTLPNLTDPSSLVPLATGNPYVGPRAFTEAEAPRFFGREREARELLALVLRERLVLFYAQSGAGKSSLLHTRLIPGLRNQGFEVLPVGRVSGELPDNMGPAAVNNIFIYNLLLSLNRGLPVTEQFPANTLGKRKLLAFLAGEEVAASNGASPASEELAPTVLIIDQFEEIVTTHLVRWLDRRDFFVQLQTALARLPNLWVVLTLREDYVAVLEPYAELLPNRLRARYYMQRMDATAALEAIESPAAAYGRPFAAGVAQTLVDNLCRVRVPGQSEAQPGPAVEPVQLQVVCYQLWENGCSRPSGPITQSDLPLGYIDQALMHFYEDALADMLRDPAVQQSGVSERMLRTWFSHELITETGIRNMLLRNEQTARTGTLANAAVDHLVRRYLLRTELRSGGAWVELVHDRFVEPIIQANIAWLTLYTNPVTKARQKWVDGGQPTHLLVTGEYLAELQTWTNQHLADLTEEEKEFLSQSWELDADLHLAAQQIARRRFWLSVVIVTIIVTLAFLSNWAFQQRNAAKESLVIVETQAAIASIAQATSEAARQIAEANASLANQQLNRQEGLKLLQEAYDLKMAGKAKEAIEKFQAASATNENLLINLDAEIEDVRRQVAIQLVQEGERLAKEGDIASTEEKFKAALKLNPPLDTPVYVNIPPGEFLMGSSDEDILLQAEETPQHSVKLRGFWIMRIEVSNAQYARCVNERGCSPSTKERWHLSQFAQQPVTNIDWFQAQKYAAWVGGRLPNEAEWEKACRGPYGNIFPWGNTAPSPQLLNYGRSGLNTWTSVGNYPQGASYYGLLDMAGNVWEWTASIYEPYSLQVQEPVSTTLETQQVVRKGGSFLWDYDAVYVRCAFRSALDPKTAGGDDMGFRVVIDGS